MDEQNKPGRCRWIALGLLVFLFQGLLPASFIGGASGLKLAEIFEQGSSELISRMFVLAGMIMSLMVSAMIIMFLVVAVQRIVAALLVRTAAVRSAEFRDTPFEAAPSSNLSE